MAAKIVRTLKVLWWVGTAVLLAWGCYLYSINDPIMHHHVDEFVFSILWLVTFPAGYLAAMAMGVAIWALEQLVPLEGTSGPLMMVLFGILVSATGFLQWFIVLPLVAKWWRTRRGSKAA